MTKKWIFIFIRIFILLFAINESSRCQNRSGDYFFNRGLYFEAITEYKRELFFKKPPDSNEIFYQIAFCYQKGNWTNKSQGFYEDLLERNISPSLERKVHFRLAELFLFSGKAELSRFELDFVNGASPYKDLLWGVSYVKEKNWRAWDSWYENYAHKGGMRPKIERINETIQQEKSLPWKDPRKAYFLSAVVPGAGQFYNGDYLNGAASFLLNGGLIYLMASQGSSFFQEDDRNKKVYFAVNFTLLYYFVFTRYYNGSQYNAHQGAIDYNRKLRDELDIKREKYINELIQSTDDG